MEQERKCKDRVRGHLSGRLSDLRKLWKIYQADCEGADEDGTRLDEYGLCFNYVEPETFKGQREGYWCYQLSTGGPGDEFRFFINPDLSVHRIEYWFLDWYDGAKVTLRGKREAFMLELWNNYLRAGAEVNQ